MADELIPLSQIADIVGGYAFKSDDFGTTGFPVVKIASIEPPRVNLASGERISSEKVSGLNRFRLNDRDIVMAMTGATIGKVGRIRSNEPAYLNQRVAKLSAKAGREFDDFIYALVSQAGFDEEVLTNSNGSAQANISTDGIGRIPVPDFSPAEQIQIGRIIGALDDKIELNRRMNETLEALAQTLFKSWFVDATQSALPKGWRETTLEDAIVIHDSKRIPLSSRERAERRGKYPYYGAASVMDYVDDFLFDGVYTLIGEDGSVVNEDDTPVLQYVWGKFWVNNHAHVLTGKNGISVEHLLLFLQTVNIRPFVTGAVQPKLNQGNLYRVPFVLPPESVCKEFGEKIAPMFARIRANDEESSTLAALRDTLLPKLLSGELRVNLPIAST